MLLPLFVIRSLSLPTILFCLTSSYNSSRLFRVRQPLLIPLVPGIPQLPIELLTQKTLEELLEEGANTHENLAYDWSLEIQTILDNAGMVSKPLSP